MFNPTYGFRTPTLERWVTKTGKNICPHGNYILGYKRENKEIKTVTKELSYTGNLEEWREENQQGSKQRGLLNRHSLFFLSSFEKPSKPSKTKWFIFIYTWYSIKLHNYISNENIGNALEQCSVLPGSFSRNKHRAVMQPGHQVNRFHAQLLKLLTHLNLNILSSKKFSETFYFKKSQRKTSLHFKYLI